MTKQQIVGQGIYVEYDDEVVQVKIQTFRTNGLILVLLESEEVFKTDA